MRGSPLVKKAKQETGAVGWVSWEALFRGSFGAYNRGLKAMIDARGGDLT